MKAGNWLRVRPDERRIFGDNLIRIDRDFGDSVALTYFYDWELKKFKFLKPQRNRINKLGMEFYQEYTPQELMASIFEDPIEGNF